MDKWFNVNEDARVWSGHADVHKMGWMRAGSAIRAVAEYSGSYRFLEFKPPEDLIPFGNGYSQYWIRKEDVSLLPFEDEDDASDDMDPDPEIPALPGDGRIGAAIRILREAGAKVTLKFGE